jgi:hypothetical protein
MGVVSFVNFKLIFEMENENIRAYLSNQTYDFNKLWINDVDFVTIQMGIGFCEMFTLKTIFVYKFCFKILQKLF